MENFGDLDPDPYNNPLHFIHRIHVNNLLSKSINQIIARFIEHFSHKPPCIFIDIYLACFYHVQYYVLFSGSDQDFFAPPTTSSNTRPTGPPTSIPKTPFHAPPFTGPQPHAGPIHCILFYFYLGQAVHCPPAEEEHVS